MSANLFQSFTENELKGNTSKCHLLIISGKNLHVNIGTSQSKNSSCERVLGIYIDYKMNFENQINQICTKTIAKIKVLTRREPFLNEKKRNLLNITFIMARYHGCFIALH